jgi:hypothetical protein
MNFWPSPEALSSFSLAWTWRLIAHDEFWQSTDLNAFVIARFFTAWRSINRQVR